MDFFTALEQMKQHKFFKREKWSATDGYVTIMPGMAMIWKFLTAPQPNAGLFQFTVEDLSATDWVELEKEVQFTIVMPPEGAEAEPAAA